MFPGNSSLDSHPVIHEMSVKFRTSNGMLSCKLIGEYFGFEQIELANVLGVPVTAILKRPDSTRFQILLGYFEKTARILPLIKSDEAFRAWVKAPNEALGGKTPQQMLLGTPHQRQQLVDLVEDVLVGQPD